MILAHAFVPHHHHIEQVCIVETNTECEDEQLNKQCEHQNGHEHHNGDEACLLKKTLAILSNTGFERNNSPLIFRIDLPDESFVFPQHKLIPEFLKQDHEFVSSFYAYQCVKSFGLRAPPSL